MKKLILFFVFCLGLALNAAIVSPSRLITWDPGVRGGVAAKIASRQIVYITLNNTSTATQIQTALNSCPSGQVVKLGPGIFIVDQTTKIPSNVTLRGSGPGVTVLQASGSFSGNSILRFENGYDYDWNNHAAATLVSPQKGDTTLNTSGAHGWNVGDYLIVDSLEQPAGDPVVNHVGTLGTATWVGRASGLRPWGQIVKVTAVPTSTSATISPGLYYAWPNTPQAVAIDGWVTNCGVEDLTVDNTSSGVRDTVSVEGGAEIWLYNVELKGSYRYMIWCYGMFWSTFEHCRFTGGVPIGTDNQAQYTSSRAYGIFVGPHASANLITNNIIEKLTMGIAWEGCVSGNVFSYNLVKDMWWQNTADAKRHFSDLGHGPHPIFNLSEGNWDEGRVRADAYWGTSSHHTFLRNRIAQIDRSAATGSSSDSQTWTVDIENGNQYFNFVGNIIGGSQGIASGGVNENIFKKYGGVDTFTYSDTNSTLQRFGFKSITDSTAPFDTNVVGTMLWWANWEYVTSGNGPSGIGYSMTSNVADTTATAIPSSYYLSGKPAFFKSLPWPVYSPSNANSAAMTDIPAGYRYQYGSDPTAGGTIGTATVGSMTVQ